MYPSVFDTKQKTLQIVLVRYVLISAKFSYVLAGFLFTFISKHISYVLKSAKFLLAYNNKHNGKKGDVMGGVEKLRCPVGQ